MKFALASGFHQPQIAWLDVTVGDAMLFQMVERLKQITAKSFQQLMRNKKASILLAFYTLLDRVGF